MDSALHVVDQNSTQPAAKMIVKRSSGGGNKKGTPADRRATHNAVERARRESLNVRFLELAANLPATCTVRRPSKNLIVNKSIDFVRTALHNDAVLRLKLDEIMRQNQSLLQEINQLRAERGLSPRANSAAGIQQQGLHPNTIQPDFTTVSAANLASFSKDALVSAFRMPGLPQPLASADFTKQVMDQNVTIDLNDVHHLFGNEGDEETLSNHASTDDFSGAASEHSHSSPVLTADGSNIMPAGVTTSAVPAISPFQVQQIRQPQYNTLMQQSGHGAYAANSANAAEVAPSYAHLAGVTSQHNTSTSSPFEYMSAMSPTTAAMFTNMVSSYSHSGNRQTGMSHAQDAQAVDRSVFSTASRNQSNANQYGTHSTYFAMPA